MPPPGPVWAALASPSEVLPLYPAARTSGTTAPRRRGSTRTGWPWPARGRAPRRLQLGLVRPHRHPAAMLALLGLRGHYLPDGRVLGARPPHSSPENRSHADWRVIPRASPIRAHVAPSARARRTHPARCCSTCAPAAAIRGRLASASSTVTAWS